MSTLFSRMSLAAGVLACGIGVANAEATRFGVSDEIEFGSYDLSTNGRFVAMQAEGSDIWLLDRKTGSKRIIASPSTGDYTALDTEGWDLSSNGRFLAFTSDLALLSNDSNGARDIYVRDLSNDTLQLASVTESGQIADYSKSGSRFPAISANGEIVAFDTHAPNLGGTIYTETTVIHNMETGENKIKQTVYNIRNYSKPELSGDGSRLLHLKRSSGASTTGFNYVTLWDLADDTYQHVIGRATESIGFELSADGRFAMSVIYNHWYGSPIHLFDSRSGESTTVSVSTDGSNTPVLSNPRDISISGEGRYLAFATEDALVPDDKNSYADIYLFDRIDHEVRRLSFGDDGYVYYGRSPRAFWLPRITEDGHYVAFRRFDEQEGYIVENPFFVPGYCQGYEQFQ